MRTAIRRPHVAFVMATLGTGGIGRMRLNLMRALLDRGARVDLLLGNADGPYVPEVDRRARVLHLGTSHALWSVPKLAWYLLRETPHAVIAEKLRGNVATLRARRLSRANVRVFASVHGVVSHKLHQQRLPGRKARAKEGLARRSYPFNDGVIAVSHGIAEDLVANFGVPPARVHVIHNPVVTSDLYKKAEEPPGHPWLTVKDAPVLMSAGRLAPEKQFHGLIEAFAALARMRPCRLIILGEGPERPRLEAVARACGVEASVSLPGFQANPFAAMARADLFVLSSAWEGFGNVLVEAMAMGVPVVSTDCPVGPREILENGRLGPLVPLGDLGALTRALAHALDHPTAPEVLREAGMRYTAEACARGYWNALGFDQP